MPLIHMLLVMKTVTCDQKSQKFLKNKLLLLMICPFTSTMELVNEPGQFFLAYKKKLFTLTLITHTVYSEIYILNINK